MSGDPRAAEPFDPARFLNYVRRVGHGGALGIAYHDHGDDWCELSLPYDERLVGMTTSGVIASGPIISLMDMATSIAIWVRIGRFRHQATLDMRVDYLRPASPGRTLFGRGECYAVTRSVGFVRGTAHDGDAADPVAHVGGTFMFTDWNPAPPTGKAEIPSQYETVKPQYETVASRTALTLILSRRTRFAAEAGRWSMRAWLKIVALLTSLLPAPIIAQPPSPVRYNQPVIAITHVRLVDGTGAPAMSDATVLIRDGRIEAVGRSRRVRVPAGATLIDGTGKTLLPGFVFLHEHLFYPVGGGHFSPMLHSFPPLYVAGGVTTARTGGTVSPYADLNLRDAIASGSVIGPDLDVTGPYVEGRGLPVLELHGLADADAAERFVNYWADEGATSFKAYMMLDRAQLRRAIDTAHRRGARITGHLCAVTYREAAEMGIDNLEHGFGAMTDFVAGRQPDTCPFAQLATLLDNVDPDSAAVRDLIAFLVARRVAVTSTLVVFEDMVPGRPRLSEAAQAMLNADARATYETVHQAIDRGDARQGAAGLARMMRLERLFVEAGGLLLAGTDPTGAGGALPGFASQRQIQLLVEAGLTFEQAVRIGTLNGAQYLGRERDIGSIAPGKRADLILVDGDPVADPAVLDRITTVFKAGVGYDRQALLDSVRGLVGYR